MPPHLLSPERLTETLATQLGQFDHINWVTHTGSTNADLMAQAYLPIGSCQLLGAHLQTAGRGRAGRVWHNTADQSLTFSCCFETDLKPLALNGLSLALGVGTCEALRAFCPAHQIDRLKLKWPNDLMFEHGKLAGILVETQINAKRIRIVVGMGINLTHAQALGETLGRQVSALNSIFSLNTDTLTSIICHVATAWHDIVFHYTQHNFLAFAPRFTQLDYLANQPIDVLQHQNLLLQGMACGIDSHGALRVCNEQGVTAVTVGDISVRLQQ
jgi:BirA family biotin operon repressor/biotin-[acetyl-CoA-carboxylase] ligase